VPGDTNGCADVFVRDRQSGTTELVSVDSSGAQGNGPSAYSAISADGRFIAFLSAADNLVAGDTNRVADLFVRDRQAGTTERVSLRSTGKQQFMPSYTPSITADGRFVSFVSAAPFVGNDTNGDYDVFVRDRQKNRTTRASVDSAGNEGDFGAYINAAQLSADGRFVAFGSAADNLVSGDTNGYVDAFIHGPWLTLEAAPSAPTAGANLTFDTWTGAASGASLLVAVDVNGTPLFQPVTPGSFDAAGVWSFSAVVPSGLSGSVVGFVSFGIVPTGKIDLSNRFDVAFQ
jgi:Tol biopolymer transport system component